MKEISLKNLFSFLFYDKKKSQSTHFFSVVLELDVRVYREVRGQTHLLSPKILIFSKNFKILKDENILRVVGFIFE